MRKLFFILVILLTHVCCAKAHVGSPQVIMQANAGPYALLISVQPPAVIPGIATVTLYVQNNAAVSSAAVRAVYFLTGTEGAPKPLPLLAVKGMPGQFTGEVWLMNSGATSMQIAITGGAGHAEVVVPVNAVAAESQPMPPGLKWPLLALAFFLVAGLAAIAAASVSDGVTTAGIVPAKSKQVLRFVFAAGTLVASAVILFGGYHWWQQRKARYSRMVFQPFPASFYIEKNNDTSKLYINIESSFSPRASSLYYVVPDHGKLMHLFVVRMPAMDAFAHLHPQRMSPESYQTILPNLPAGKYIAFADVVYNTGFTETIRGTFSIEQNIQNSQHLLDADDGQAFAIPANLADKINTQGAENMIVCGKAGSGVKMSDGNLMAWEAMPAIKTGQLYTLKFAVTDSLGKPVQLQPYLGMAGHAAIIRNDGNVYMHLHPAGTFSSAAQYGFQKRLDASGRSFKQPEAFAFKDSVDMYMQRLQHMPQGAKDTLLQQQMVAEGMPAHRMTVNNMVEFPYAFPAAGEYRIWVQVKINGKVVTAAFDKTVE